MFCITDISEYNPKEFCKIPLMWRTVCKNPCCNKVVFCCVFVLWHFALKFFRHGPLSHTSVCIQIEQ